MRRLLLLLLEGRRPQGTVARWFGDVEVVCAGGRRETVRLCGGGCNGKKAVMPSSAETHHETCIHSIGVCRHVRNVTQMDRALQYG